MKRHLAYLKYVLRHKWFVLVAGLRLGNGVSPSLWALLIHDWTKFLPSEWFPYARTFYASDGTKRYQESEAFAMAWNYHQKRHPHHWQYWLLTWDRGESEPIEMPFRFLMEMLADWMGAGRAITGEWGGTPAWYEKNKDKIKLHPKTRKHVEWALGRL